MNKRKRLSEMSEAEFADTMFNPKRRRIAAMAIDWFIVAIVLFILIILIAIPAGKLQIDRGLTVFDQQYEQILNSNPYGLILFFIYDLICHRYYQRSYGQEKLKIRIIETQQTIKIPLVKQLIRSIIFSYPFLLLVSGFLMLFIPPYKSIEDHLLRYEVVVDDNLT